MKHSVLARRMCLLTVTSLAAFGFAVPAASAQVTGRPAAPAPGPHSAYALPATKPPWGPLSKIGLGDLPAHPGQSGSEQAAMRVASARAMSTRHAVGIPALTTATTTVAAEPNGKLSLTESLLPVRVRRGSGWVPVDTRLRLAGGRLVPVAVPGSVSFSAGGRAVLAVLGDGGRSISLTWPGRLPVPQVSGSEADYRNVLPGVDLTMTASVTGIAEVLVVHSAAAARNPRLESLRLGIAGTGVRVAQLDDRSLAALTPAGQTAFTAAPPLMWNSAAPPRAPAAIGRRAASGGNGLRSSATGPGLAARVARATMRLGRGGVLTIAPSRSMLAAPPQDFPLYIDPTFQPGGPFPDSYFDMVQETSPCNSVPYTNNENPNENPDSLGVGYFPSSFGACYGTQNAYYTMPIPATLEGAYIYQPKTVFDASEDYSASCTADHDVNLIQTDGITNATDYQHQPAWHPSELSVTQNGTGIPDTAGDDINCNLPAGTPLGPSTDAEPYAFQVGPAVARALTSPYESSVTFVLTETSQDSSGDSLKRFTNNPSLQVQYDFPPNIPVYIRAGDNSSEMLSCGTSSPLTTLGASSGTGVELKAEYAQYDAENLNIYFKYWDVTAGQNSSTNAELPTTLKGSSTYVYSNPVTIPQSAVNKMTNGDKVEVQTYSEDIADRDSPTATCYFIADPHDPGGTKVTMTSPANPPMGTTATFTLAADTPAECTASSFEYELDKAPVSGAESTVTAKSGTATVSIVVPAPGVHELFAYANCSNNVNPTTDGSASFSAAGDLALNCASWSAAMTDDCTNSSGTVVPENFDNTMLSGDSGSCPGGTGDGGGRQFDFSQLEAQGWKPNGNVTIDGADFALPDFGSCATDNVLAADQTISMSGNGSALVFLATSTSAFAGLPGATGAPGTQFGSEAAAPPVPSGIGVSGSGCTVLTAFSDTDTGCQPASGTITYTNGTTAPYVLSVPDWVNGPGDIAAVATTDRDQVGGSSQADDPKIYAFAVPLNPGLQLASITLPDVDDTVSATGLNYTFTGLHIFGMSVRNTTTGTPAQGGQVGTPTGCGCAWTGSYESPIEAGWGPVSGGFGNRTIRLAVSMNTSAPAGSLLRIRLSDPGFLWGDTDGPIAIGDATVAKQSSGAVPAATPQPLYFDGASTVTMCAGCDVYSDSLTLPFAVTAGQNLLVSLFVANGSSSSEPAAFTFLPGNSMPSGASEWTSPAGTGDQTSASSATAVATDFPASGWQAMDYLLWGVDVTTAAETVGGMSVPGDPTVVVAGNNVTDAWGTGVVVAPDYGSRSGRLAGQLASNGTAAGYGVVDAGIEANQAQADGAPYGGVSLLARLDRDVLAEPDVGTVIVDEGLEDLLQDGASGSSDIGDDVETALSQLKTILYAYGITVVFATLTPCAGYPGSGSSPEDSCPAATAGVDSTVDAARQQTVNGWIGSNLNIATTPNTLEADTDCEVSSQGPDGCSDNVPETLYTGYGAGPPPAGDWANLTKAGYAQAVQAVTAQDLSPMIFPGSTS